MMTEKEAFINNEIWILTFAGGFQRANVYANNPDERLRTAFRAKIRGFIEELVAEQYQKAVSEDTHIQNIKSISAFANELKIGGLKATINFGVAQKLLNLYLKYLWCLGQLKTHPPHFPVDRIIQEKLNKEAKDYKLKPLTIEAWTQFEDEVKYLAVIRFAESLKSKNPLLNVMSLAELELYLFSRKSL